MNDTQPLTRHRILTLALPIMLANITVPLVGLVDTAVMGRMQEPAWLAASTIGATLFSMIFWLFGFLRMGTGGLIAQARGRHAVSATGESTETIFYRAMVVALLCATLLLVLQWPVFALAVAAFDADQQVQSLTRDYYGIRIWAAPATLMLYAISGTLIGLQRMRALLANQLLLNLANIILNIVFFRFFGWGIKGVALASVLADYLALLGGLWLLRKEIPLQLHRLWQAEVVDSKALIAVVRINADLLVRTLCLSLAFYWLTVSGAQLGTLTLAVNAVLIQLIHLMSYGLDGFSHAVETLAGYAYGKRDQRLLRDSIRFGTEWGLLMAAAIAMIYGLWGERLVALITTQLPVREAAALYLPWIALSPLVAVWGFILDGVYIGVTHTRDMRNAMIQSLLLFVAGSILLIAQWGNHGLWMSYYWLMILRGLTLTRTLPRIFRPFSPTEQTMPS